MARILAVLFAFLMVSDPAFSADAVDVARTTCKDYAMGSRRDMVDIVAALHEALTGNSKFDSLDEDGLDAAVDKACRAHPDDKVIDALRAKN
jgi:hypothetical protein